jgi:hypothetical protein
MGSFMHKSNNPLLIDSLNKFTILEIPILLITDYYFNDALPSKYTSVDFPCCSIDINDFVIYRSRAFLRLLNNFLHLIIFIVSIEPPEKLNAISLILQKEI